MHPATIYSASRAAEPETNEQMIAKLTNAAMLNDESVENLIANIVYADTFDGKKRGEWACNRKTGYRVSGGRLGLAVDHSFEAVPPHFCRDRLLDWIQTTIAAEDYDTVTQMVFDDLSTEDIAAYGDQIRMIQEADERNGRVEEMTAAQSSSRALGRAKNEMNLDSAIYTIDSDVDLQPNGFTGFRKYRTTPPIFSSVLAPHGLPTEEERAISGEVGTFINMDADQIRAMIVRLILYGKEGWTVETFRHALSYAQIPQLTKFLQHR